MINIVTWFYVIEVYGTVDEVFPLWDVNNDFCIRIRIECIPVQQRYVFYFESSNHIGYLAKSSALLMPSAVTPNFLDTSIKAFCFKIAEPRPEIKTIR